jgi:hypothetical protein
LCTASLTHPAGFVAAPRVRLDPVASFFFVLTNLLASLSILDGINLKGCKGELMPSLQSTI